MEKVQVEEEESPKQWNQDQKKLFQHLKKKTLQENSHNFWSTRAFSKIFLSSETSDQGEQKRKEIGVVGPPEVVPFLVWKQTKQKIGTPDFQETCGCNQPKSGDKGSVAGEVITSEHLSWPHQLKGGTPGQIFFLEAFLKEWSQ